MQSLQGKICMNKSIYTEYTNLTPDHKTWLDGCGATWLGDIEKFTQYVPFEKYVVFNGKEGNKFTQSDYLNTYAHIPTGSEFCERVAEILGIEKPVFGKSLDETLSENCHIQQVIDENSGPTFAEIAESLKGDPKDMPFNYPHRLYRVLDSLGGIPFDKRIPLSEWIPPMGERVCFIWGELFYAGFVLQIDQRGLFVQQDKEGYSKSVNLDGHWMRIV